MVLFSHETKIKKSQRQVICLIWYLSIQYYWIHLFENLLWTMTMEIQMDRRITIINIGLCQLRYRHYGIVWNIFMRQMFVRTPFDPSNHIHNSENPHSLPWKTKSCMT